MLNNEKCSFCKIANTNRKRIEKFNRPIIEDESFFVVPALGQFTEGYLLLCTKAHIPNFGALEQKVFQRFLALKEQIRELLFEAYGCKPIFFEHGTLLNDVSEGSCIEHAHLHAIPLNLNVLPSWVTNQLRQGEINDVSEIILYSLKRKPYFYFECSNGRMYLCSDFFLPCQYGRQIVARLIGLAHKWNWRAEPFYERMLETSCYIRSKVSKSNEDC